jgi:methyltransferase family protein
MNADLQTAAFDAWLAALESRHLADLRFSDVRRALQALSSLYVERRGRLASGSALDGVGKRAAFALFYGPLHFLFVRRLVRALDAARPGLGEIVELGCGTGAAGAAWALEAGSSRLHGVDRSAWAVQEARWTWQRLGLEGQARQGDADRTPLPGAGGGVLAAYTANEMEPAARARLLRRLLQAGGRGARLLVVEPIARSALPWWEEWAEAFLASGGRQDEWRFAAELPELLQKLDQAAGLRHRELTGRTLYLDRPERPAPRAERYGSSERAHNT